jgi:hypothetical protein
VTTPVLAKPQSPGIDDHEHRQMDRIKEGVEGGGPIAKERHDAKTR